ncbi:Hexose carrier protein HEX6 [Acorus calamus]|uniref:Hexose carrier protein HEX6 n=1 Tax=Acorus calamus TaxID=4465 RepID=A0AAV9CSX0_ACOCL|nr:Hexose carrier protein HEX6 [Acorus calamus]
MLIGWIIISILTANLINYATSKIKSGKRWRISLDLTTVPNHIITLSSLFLPDNPNSLIDRDNDDTTKDMLRRIHSISDIDLVTTMEAFKAVEKPWRNVLKKKSSRRFLHLSMVKMEKNVVMRLTNPMMTNDKRGA